MKLNEKTSHSADYLLDTGYRILTIAILVSKSVTMGQLPNILILIISLPLLQYRQDGADNLRPCDTGPVIRGTVFRPGQVSTGLHEHGSPVFCPSDDLFLWTISLHGQKIILESDTGSGLSEKPVVSSFSGIYRDEYPIFSPDGLTLYFMSWRPDNEGFEPLQNFRHWKVKRLGNQWGTPELNNAFDEDIWAYSMSEQGTLFGWGTNDAGRSDADIYYQEKSDDVYLAPVNMGDSINSEAIEYCPFISSDGSTLIFARMGIGEMDGLYISHKSDSLNWSKAKRLPEKINLSGSERFPTLSIDGKTLYFNRQISPFYPYSIRRLSYMDIEKTHLRKPAAGTVFYVSLDDISR